jgi:hypothetical protein
MIEVFVAAVMCCVLFYAPALLTSYWGQPRLLASLLSLAGLAGLTVIIWLVTAYWMRPISQNGPPRRSTSRPRSASASPRTPRP